MSSGEGAEEAAKDAADIATFFKSGKPEVGHCSRTVFAGVGGCGCWIYVVFYTI